MCIEVFFTEFKAQNRFAKSEEAVEGELCDGCRGTEVCGAGVDGFWAKAAAYATDSKGNHYGGYKDHFDD